MSSRDELTARISLAMRDVIAHAVLTNERIARSIGINVVDLQTVGVILRIGPTTPSELAKRTALPSSTVTRVLDRLRGPRLHPTCSRPGRSPSRRRRGPTRADCSTRTDPTPTRRSLASMRQLHETLHPDGPRGRRAATFDAIGRDRERIRHADG